MTKRIPYKLVKTENKIGTIYHRVSDDALKQIRYDWDTIIGVDDLCKKDNNPVSTKLNTKDSKYGYSPELRTHNTIRTLCEGLRNNFNKGQYDLSFKQTAALTAMYKTLHAEIPEVFDEVEFFEVNTLPRTPVVQEVDTSSTTFSDLFEVTITIRKK